MKLRGIHLFPILVIFGLTTGYLAAPPLLELCLPQQNTGQKDKIAKAPTITKKDYTVGDKETINLDDLFGDDSTPAVTAEHDDEIVDIPPSDDDKIDPTSFDDSSEEESEEETTRRLTAFRKRPASDSTVIRPVEEPYVGKEAYSVWSQTKILKRRLASRIRSKMKGVDPAQIEAFLKAPENRLAIAQWQLLNMGDEKLMTNILKDRSNAKLLAPLLNDLQWMTEFVYDGELKNPDVALAILAHLRAIDPNMDIINLTEEKGEMLRDQHIKRRIAGAIAAEYSNNGWIDGTDKKLSDKEIRELAEMGIQLPKASGSKNKSDLYRLARERYLFFAEGVNERLFNPNFYTTSGWLMRFVCGWKDNTSFGTASTLRWHRDNNSAPADSYLGMCSDVPYLPTNIFGDSIHGPFYYQPFDVLYPGNFCKETRDVGAVCGGLSHYGASAACANGIPAFTMGEPGHCAYAVYNNEKWVPCNSIFPEKFPHWSFWGDHTWSTLTLYTNMYHDGQRTRDAQLIATMAALLAEYNNPNNALKAYEISIAMQPINRNTWNNYVTTAVKTLRRNPARWLTVNSFLCDSMAPTNPSACANFLIEQIYPSMLEVLRGGTEKINAYKQFFQSLDVQEENAWKIEELLELQYAALGRSSIDHRKHYEMLAQTVCEKPEFGLALTWAICKAYGENRLTGEKLMKELENMRSSSSKVKLVDAAIIRAAEQMGNMELFQKYSAPYAEGTGGMPSLPLIAGNIISDKGMIQLSSYDEDLSQIINHAAALTTKGGYIASEGGKHQKVTVILPKAERIGAIIIVPASGSASSYYEWNLEISKDGKTWETIAALPEKSPNASVNIIINKSHPTAKYIRIDSGSDQTLGIKFKAILVYDNKKVK